MKIREANIQQQAKRFWFFSLRMSALVSYSSVFNALMSETARGHCMVEQTHAK